MKKILTICLIIISLDLIFIFKPKESFSKLENRYLQDYPNFSFIELENGDYTKKINNYLQDHFPFRSFFVNLKTNVDKLMLKNNINGVYIGKDGYLIEEYKQFNRDKIIDILNNFKSDNVSLMLVPTSISINQDKIPNYINNTQVDDMFYIYDHVDMNTINIYKSLVNSKYQAFYKTDHHWTLNGSYIGYKEYRKSIKKDYVLLNDLESYKVTDEFYGSIYSKLNDYTIKPDSMYAVKTDKLDVLIDGKKSSIYDKSYLTKKDKYSYFLSGNHGMVEITNNKNKGSILVIKDSYGNALVPYLTYNYNKVYVVDLRYYKGTISEFIKTNNIDETLILYNMNTITTESGIIKLK